MKFSEDWKYETRERAEAQSFWNDFFNVFGINRRRIATFEEPVKKLNNNYGFIDLFWKGNMLVEHKSKGQDLDKAYSQALDYFANLKEYELPKYVLVSDFERFKLHNLDEGEEYEFKLSKLHENINLLGFIAGYTQKKYRNEVPVNVTAAEKMGQLHDELSKNGFNGHELEMFLVRLLFCMFADDSGMFEKSIFADYIRDKTNEDGSDLGEHLSSIFQTVDTVVEARQINIDKLLNDFPYVNGPLFKETLRIVHFDSKLRDKLSECCGFNWSNISPAIFGSMFQAAMNSKKRRSIGAHYTTETNIMRLIEPLFLKDLREEFERIKHFKTKKIIQLKEFHKKISGLKFFDPACGCGNFLVVTYRELRRLEIELLIELLQAEDITEKQLSTRVSIDQFYGIDIEEFPVRIAVTAMWLMDHQLNLELSAKVDIQRVTLPLNSSVNILHHNALVIDWNTFAPRKEIDYIIGNPPFIGLNYQSQEQKNEVKNIFKGVKKHGVLDYISAWFLKAAKYIQGTKVKVAFVATNSITMGEQVGIIWNELFNAYNIKIHFAHRTFAWSSEATGAAAVHVVIIGFASYDVGTKVIFEYEDINCEPSEKKVKNINPYLTNNDDIVVLRRRTSICKVPKMRKGNQPTDNGHLLLTNEEKINLIEEEPNVAKYIKRFMGAREFLYNTKRWCLWLVGAPPNEIRALSKVTERIKKVKEFREKSTAKDTQKNAATPSLFREQNNPSAFLVIPSTTSEHRKYIPIGFFGSDVIPSNLLLIIPDANLYHFGVLSSLMHMVWVKYTCGRLESRTRYSKEIVYNNFPWPKIVSEKQILAVEKAAQAVLSERSSYLDSSLADIYDPLTMPPKLVDAHRKLDRAVDKCYQKTTFVSELERIESLLKLYAKLV